ncbi:E3 ubiquitin-protein ligase HERC2 [Phytophthora nicotianae]|uniref:E3 ubiquitin-protein ligase HERC2 n=1 Tax=Phytophthora nicotianae TaxID=4792 RepID=A0A0W8BX49_PHYNI|nr:E3 ubiquitin-protein ligase HERC2 [Phytophthora nicotianae]
MGQQVSLPAAVTQPPGERAKLRPLQAPYVPLCDVLKAGDTVAEDAKDAMDKILEFGAALRYLPKESEVSGRLQTRSPEQQMKELMNPVDSVDELFQHISQLAGLPTHDGRGPARPDAKRDACDTMPGVFDARVASYVKNLQVLYQMTKKEKHRHEQRLLAARAHAMSLSKVAPPPLPIPTQNCLTMGWDLVVMLLKATHKNNPEQYEQALQMVKDNLKPLKPTAYSDSMYLAPSASSAFTLLSDCLGDLAYPAAGGSTVEDAHIGARTIETLAEVGLARGSLATMLFVILWLMKQQPTSSVNLETSISKLAALKEQPMYGKCEASGELYSCGQNSYGELGTGDDIERHQLTSVSLCGWDDIRQVVSGNETLAVLTNGGVVLTCGLNKSGQCGQGHFDERVMMLRPVQALRSQRVKFIAASNGCEHMIALTDSGLAYSWGYNDRGQLGHENLTTKIHVPKLIESLKDKKLRYASVSYHHSAVITDSGELYTFGMNDCGQLGLDHTQHQTTPQLVKSLEGTEVSMVACGLYHTIICTAAGGLYTCGKNDYGQLGLGHNRQIKMATLVSVPNEMVCFLACGYYHSMIVTTSGRTFSFGRNDYGQLGIGNKVHQNVLNVVALSANTRMVRATCGCYHTVLLSEQGQVFVFGRNNKGQLGNRGSADALLPVPLKVRPEKNARRCVDVAAGFYTTSLIVERKRENDEGDSIMLDQSCVISVCGRVDIDRSGEIEGLSNFGSISTIGVSLFQGKWFYEVEVVTSGLIQVGWIDGYFQGSSDQGEGVGDHAHSWSYDAGNDIPAEEADSVQLSRCLYRSLCIDPKETTFSALFALLEDVTTRFFGIDVLDEQSNSASQVTHILYPLLVTIRLLKLNFFEFARSCLDGSEIGLPAAANQAGGVLCSIREMLFTIADYVPKTTMSGEVLWFYHAVKQETALAIYHGFPTLFPSLLDRLQIMNRLMVNKPNFEAELTPAQKLLIPKLVPCFTSAKMLFQLISDPNVLFKVDGLSDDVVSESVITFMGTLLDSLWVQTKDAMERCAEDTTKLMKSFDAIETSHEFNCLNIMLRAAIFWCSCSTSRGWVIIESVCTKVVDFVSECLNQCSTMKHDQNQLLPVVIQRSFSGKLLPFMLLSVFSLPSVRDALPGLLDPFWPRLEALSVKLHIALATLSKQGHLQPTTVAVDTRTALGSNAETDFVDTALASMSKELSTCLLNQSTGSSVTYGQIFKNLWDKIVHAKGYTSRKVKELPQDVEIRRVTIPLDLAKLFGTETLLVKVQTAGSGPVLEYEPRKVSFLPSRTILSQHLYPVSENALPAPGDEATVGLPLAPQSLIESSLPSAQYSDKAIEDSHEWLKDLQKVIVWVGSHYAATLILGGELDGGVVSEKWLQASLFRGGLDETWPATDTTRSEVGRNETLLLQVIENVGNGKKLLDKVRNALDPGSAPGGGNPQFRIARLKRQDSVEAQLEKSGSIEAVDRAVRATFAALLKHTNISYTTEPISNQGTLAETVVDAWKAALQLRRWIVREQQKLAAAVRLCAACYDDNRGDLDCAYNVYTCSESEEDQIAANTVLCPPRRSWNDKIAALSDVFSKSTMSNAARDRNTAAGQTGRSESLLSVASFEECELFSCGQNNYGELCLGHCNSTSKLEHVPFFSAKGIRDIAGGNEVLAVVTTDGTVFTCGLNKSGQCGNGTFEERVIIATPVRALSGITINMVAAANGCEHMLAVASDGAVFSWGYNDRGQLGLGSTISKSHTPRMIDSLREKYHITTAAVSYHHSAVVSSNGELLTFGMNDCGQLGLDHTQHQHTPQLVEALSSQVVTKVACGLYHTIAVTSGGEVYSFGKNDYGQLALGHARNMKAPTLVKTSLGESDEKIVAVSCGYYHTVTISEKGKLITWGRNDYGQLGIGSKEHKNSAQFVPLPLSSKIKTASCGCYHTLILMANGRVMVFGRNNKGQLGAGSRTLPSADLPLPVPSNSLANDEVVRIAAGFYSSYILTGRSGDSPGLDGTPDDANQAKDLPENSCLANSDALFESLMKEIDSKYVTDAAPKRASLQHKRGYPQRKLPLVKLHAAGWAMARALMYRSLQDADDKISNRLSGRVNPVLAMFISFLLENLKLLQGDTSTVEALTTTGTHELGGSVSLKRVCVGLLQYFGGKFAVPTPTAGPVGLTLDNLHGNLYRNQILSVLLACGSANTKVGSTIAANPVVTAHIISGMSSSDLASATMCIRLAMLVFPHHSVSALNTIYRSQQSAPVFSGDILSMLMTLVGLPMLLRPRLCSHELGLECSSTALCQSACCLKGITVTKDSGISHMQQVVLEKAHVADSKAAEVVALLRYLTFYPTWKVAINAAITRGFAKSNKVGELLDAICAYYTNVQQANIADLKAAVLGGLAGEKNATALRKPESTSLSPETDEPVNNTVESNTQSDESESTSRDKQSLMLWQKAKDALNGLATIIAAVSIVGGHVEGFREGGCVTIEDDGTQGSSRLGVLSGVMRDPRTADLLAKVVVSSSTEGPVSPLIAADARAQSFPLSKLQVVERIPALVDMFGDVDSIITTLSSIVSEVLTVDKECATHCDIDLPQNSSVQEVLRNRLKVYKQQIRWRSAKALSSLLKQIPTLSPTLISMDSQLISSLATLLSSENSLSWVSKSEIPGLETATALQKRWICVKQRKVFLDTEDVIDTALDYYEAKMRNEVVQKLGSENALSWGMDAIQSPRRKVTHPSFAGSGFGENGRAKQRSTDGDLPFGTWGVLLPLPPLNENEHTVGPGSSAIDYTPFPLTAPIIRVGRAADACDLIVNDRSVSGRHFHLRRLRREAEGGETQFELQDFSKNGTVVNGVRIHGSTTRITSGSRISLILSRGGLVTYEFQVRTSGGNTGSRNAPPHIVTAPQNSGDLNISIPGQEYQQPQAGTSQIVPRSPAELQNRGIRGSSIPTEVPADNRSRQAVTQGLRVITSVAESDVPRALLSPNPAVDSPRAGGYSSPRSSVLQAPGTPSVGPLTPSMFSSMIPPAILSPASYQQRESVAPNENTGLTSPQGGVGSMLRIALGRDSVNRESSSQRSGIPSELAKTRVLRSSGQTGLAARSNATPAQEMQVLTLRLLARTQEANLVVSATECEEALQVAAGNMDEAFATIQRSRGSNPRMYPSSVRHLAMVLGRSEPVCSEALRQTDGSFGDALRLLMSTRKIDLEKTLSPRYVDADVLNDGNLQSSEPLENLQDLGDENPSYALTESSALRPPVPPRLAARGNGSPVKTKKMEHTGNMDTLQPKSDLTLWSECNSSFDEGVRQMNSFEVEVEEEVLCERLAAIHARKILLQIVRLYTHASQTEEAPLSELTNPLVLRSLISILSVPEQANASSSYELEYQLHQQPKAKKSGKIQQILSRMAHDMMARSPTETLAKNFSSSQNLSTLQRSIDQVTEQPTKIGWTGITRLIESLVENEQVRGEDVNDQDPLNTLENITFETILHILSRTYATPMTAPSWDSSPLRTRKADGCFPKGPMRLSCGLEVVVVDTYERLWSIPPPDPLLKHRHKWRKRFSSTAENGWMKSAADYAVTIWRPILPPAMESASSASKWFCLGDVAKCSNGAPNAPMLLVSDGDNQGLLVPPVSFERVDITGKGLPRNSESDPDFQRKQLRSIWWPVAPSGYVSLGCIAGSKEDPFEPPDVSSTRCVREDIVKRVEGFHCVWRADSPAATGGGGVELLTTIEVENDEENAGGESDAQRNHSTKNQSTDASRLQLLLPVADDVVVQTSLWAVDSDFSCGLLLPVVTLNDASANEPSTAFALNLSDDDLVLCAPVSVDNVLVFLEILLQYQQLLSSKQEDKQRMSTQLRSELPAALFALIQQVLRENQPSSGKAAVSLVRALITVIQRGAHWYDKQALLYCRSKIMALSQDQDGGFTLHALLQAFVELMLAVEDQQHTQRVQELAACLDRDSGNALSLPYRFHFAKQPFVEMLVSHSSKMAVTRHLSGEERKFLLDYHAEDSSNRDALAVEGLGAPPGEVYSCRFEHTPALVMTMRDEVKAELVYFEVGVMEWSTNSSMGGSLALGFSPPSFPLEGVLVGGSADGSRSYSFAPASGQVLCAGDTAVDRWRWIEPVGAVSPGDVFGCGLRLDTQEIFFCKNGQLLGTAFSSISRPQQLHPTISFNADCKLLANLGATTATPAKHANFSFRFHSLDCDNLMSAFEWFEPLSQVYGVMKALMDPERPDDVNVSDGPTDESTDAAVVAQLPDEFMLSADNFLSDISEDVCIRVESAHPYDLELQESLVSIPLATSIRVRLDPQSETASSHCLQILQGGSTEGECTTTGEAEVRAFTGVCGSQEVTIDGDSFVWRFPVQSNFQCRVDRVRKGPYLKLEARDTRLSLVRDKGWQTAIGVARFDGGIHIWEVRISFVTASSNIFLGIGRRDVRLDSYLGKDNRGWGWIGNRALWHNGSKQRGTYGDKFKTGDIVRLTLDLRRGTLSYALNGKDLGVAFGPGGTGPKLEGTFYPAFALYNQRDSIDLIGGHRVEDGGLEPGLSRTGSGLASGDDSYYSEEEEEDLGGLVSDEGDGSIPNFRMELAIALSQMGFPMEWCLYALRHCEDDAEQAADYILANMHAIESLVREENETMARRTRHRQLLHEQALALSERDGLDTSLPPPPPIDEDIDGVRPPEDVASTGDESPPQQQQSTGDTKWGMAFTAVPEFSVTGRRLLATKYGPKLHRLHASQRVFTPARDRALVQLVNAICESRAEALLSCDPLRMTPEEFVPTEEQIHRFQSLRGVSLEALQRRFLVLRNFNCRLQTSLAFIDFSAADERSLLARGARELRGVVFQHVKLAWWLGVLKEQQAPAAARPEIEVDRHRAHEALELSERGDPLASEVGERDSVFAQTFEQLHGLQPALLRGADRAFKCQFVGEFGDDFGGLYRECLAQLSSELQTFTPLLPVLRPCPNALMSTGENRELFVPNSHLRTHPRRVQMAEFLGKLAGVAVRTKTPLDLNLPPAVWKLLVGQRVTRHDIEAIHQGCFQVVDTIASLDAHGITEEMFDDLVDANFTVLSSTRETVELVPGGKHLHVTWGDREEYASAVETYRLTEFAPVCGDISRGVGTILPAPTLGIFSWHELRTLICGKPTVDIVLLRRRTIYGDGCQATDPHIAYFWDVLAEFTDEQKSSFLRFVWGRSRLPTHAADFTQDFKISGLPKATGRADMYLPIAHTCFFSIDLPAYSCREVMRDKLVYAITHCQSIDADNTTVAQRAGQGINWTNTAATATATASAAVSGVIAGVTSGTGE